MKQIDDLLNHLPTRYLDYSNLSKISDLKVGDIVTIKGKIVSLKNVYTKRGLKMQVGSVQDDTSKLSIVWFNQPFLVKTFYPGRNVALSGKVSLFSGKTALVSPEYEILTELHDTVHTGRLVPIYPETSDISSKRIRTNIRRSFDSEIKEIKEFLPPPILKKYNLLEIKKAYKLIHFPKTPKEAEEGKKRIAFNELLKLQLDSLNKKLKWQKNRGKRLVVNKLDVGNFIKGLPFRLTNSQKIAVDEIFTDMSKDIPMNRLLEGDVGSGKTIVAAIAAFASFTNRYQSVFMAPTQILAQQHYQTLKKLLPKLKISLVISNGQRLMANDSDVFVGTHALIHTKLDLKNVALVVIDEQHRFGVLQREKLIKMANVPHVLTMTATPIPRTMALTLYGDLDLSTLTEMPIGREKVTTWLVPPQKREGAYKWIRSQISNLKSQVFIVCPLIEESEKETMKDIKNVTQEFQNLKLIMKNLKLGLLHGKLKSKEKEKVLNDFRNRKIDILVTTPVVEVGIDIPNATIMVIEAAERFGLAQLHQLRGRVGRGGKKSYCLLFSNIKSSKRLTAMTKTNSGIELSELDLKLRGPGEIFGTLQHGIPEFKAASWNDLDLIKQTRELAKTFLL